MEFKLEENYSKFTKKPPMKYLFNHNYEYLFIPLGKNRKKQMCVFKLTKQKKYEKKQIYKMFSKF